MYLLTRYVCVYNYCGHSIAFLIPVTRNPRGETVGFRKEGLEEIPHEPVSGTYLNFSYSYWNDAVRWGRSTPLELRVRQHDRAKTASECD